MTGRTLGPFGTPIKKGPRGGGRPFPKYFALTLSPSVCAHFVSIVKRLVYVDHLLAQQQDPVPPPSQVGFQLAQLLCLCQSAPFYEDGYRHTFTHIL